ncbi:NADase-type glycan-binding domain-containing protein [Nocardioides alcanivorans]|uniref:NADase-type glycan-binding domain-containing protein n=1 Tax=Nocardioides alcanivorans TaxID=2897352 RepID=UPI001F199589|nr:zinc ribbon domain-containing protein [Nocardioides alcanivorans]
MSFCTNCGAQLGFGRFCTNCGQPIPETGDTAPPDVDSTQVRLPRVQPDAATGPRFPLYADPTDPAAQQPPPTAGTPQPYAAPAETPSAHPHPYPTVPPTGQVPPDQQRKRSPWPWVLLTLVLLLGLGGAAWALSRDDDTDASGGDPSGQVSPTDPESSASPSESLSPSESTSPSPDGDPVDLASEAQVTGPRPTQPGQSVDGTQVRYPATNMLDNDPTTAYRIDGDATGATITFTFDEPVTIREIGMINGYAKVDGQGAGRRDWYVSNRKVLRAEWTFDDGTSAVQELRRTTDLQVMQVAATTTQTITLRLLRVSKPGSDPRNTTAISSVLLRGHR